MEKSATTSAFYTLAAPSTAEVAQVFANATTTGPWGPDAQHGGPPSALLGRGVEHLAAATGGGVVGRVTVDLLGPVPLGALEVRASVLRPGRSVRLLGAELRDPARARTVATARAWVLPERDDGPGEVGPAPGHAPADGEARGRPDGWHPGYLDAIEWRWIAGGLDRQGSGTVWMRPPPLVEGEDLSPLQRVLTCVDSASGVSAGLDITRWAFLNTELTVHQLRPLEGEWVAVEAETTLGPGSVGVCTSRVSDERGLVARSAQTLLVVRRD